MIQFPTLTIAGFDPSGGAGLQADLKTFTVYGNYGMSVLTVVAVQNTLGVKSCYTLPSKALEEQLEAVFDDIPPAAIKLGMLYNEEIIRLVADILARRAPKTPLVLDPVMRAKSGDPLLLPEAEAALIRCLLPLATIVTPNLPEAYALLGGGPIPSVSGVKTPNLPDEEADYHGIAEKILALGAVSVLVKGGHDGGAESRDYFLQRSGESRWFSAPRIATKNSHGTGCTLSAAIAAGLAQGMELAAAVQSAKIFLTGALKSASQKSLGAGAGPTDHTWTIPPNPSQGWQ